MNDENSCPILVFDLGGTGWRSAICSAHGDITDLNHHPAVTKANTGSNVATLREILVAHVLDRARELLSRRPEIRIVSISIGAAVNGHTGLVLASAPLWGDCIEPYDFHAELSAAEPGLQWCIANDLTCLALAIRARESVLSHGFRSITVVSVGSGIAARTIDVDSGELVLNPMHGIQGEIGHLPSLVTPPWGAELPVCDCGAVGHVAAISAGKAIERHLSQFAQILGTPHDRPTMSHVQHLREALDSGNASATKFLDYVTAPLAMALLYLMTIDARVGHVYVSGGVVDVLGPHYMSSLYRNMEGEGLYLISTHQPTVVRDTISNPCSDGLDPLRGAGLFARQQRPGGVGVIDRS
ncbi:ROK family protein [Nocardia suismassiliense]|uniref:ROK family protein n=1 Tax=Nocardia suismassiliense TaxID=2077092 RepID=A0ABW6QSB0_9NOCA